MKPDVPLCVDLDGTLLATDCLWESFVYALKRNPLIAFLVPIWLMQGRAALKNRLAKYAKFDLETLPENTRFLAWLVTQVNKERKVYLVSASDQKLVTGIASIFGFFTEAIGSDGTHNLRGSKKAEYLVERFGDGGFDYAGNDASDLAIWKHSRKAIMVNTPASVIAAVPEENRKVINEDRPGKLMGVLRAIRPHQWMKNLLILVPMVAAHVWTSADSLVSALLAFVSFSLCASAVYLLNDLTDLESDRLHITKRNRPFASGVIPLYYGIVLSPLFLIGAFLLMTIANPQAVPVLSVYFVATCLYSFWLKQVAAVDIVLLAGLYTLRLLVGAAVVSVELSQWLLAFSMFFFLSLAMAKRFSELYNIKEEKRLKVAGRGYIAADLELMAILGACSSYISVFVLALYVNSKHVVNLYSNPQWIWLVCPVMLVWVTRFWLETHRGRMDEDPISFAVKDGFSYGTVVMMAVIAFLAGPI